MRIQHNILAMNSYRNYSNNTSSLSKNLEKLSSGYKINRAGDDAAGLAISEKMRAQIQGLSAAQKNVKDGISLVKTAEGAMQEIQDMLSRMKYLATQSANGTYQDDVDREALQDEVDALKSEIDRIAQAANFNGTALLYGTAEEQSLSVQSDDGFAVQSGVPVGQALNLKSEGSVTIEAKDFATDSDMPLTGWTNIATATAGASDAPKLNGTKLAVTVTVTGADGKTTKEMKIEISLVSAGAGTSVSQSNGQVSFGAEAKLSDIKLKIEEAIMAKITSADGQGGTAAAMENPGTYIANASLEIDQSGAVTGLKLTTATYEAGGTSGSSSSSGKNTVKPTDDDAKMTIKTEGAKGYTVGSTVKVGGITFKIVGKNDDADFQAESGDTITVKVGDTPEDTLQKLADAINDSQEDLEFEVSGTDLIITPKREMTTAEYKALLNGLDLGEELNDALSEAKTAVLKALTQRNASAGYEPIDPGEPVDIILQIGDTGDGFNQLKITINAMDCASIGIDGLNIGTLDDAHDAVDSIEDAINLVSSNRGKLGALQNRLEHTQNNLSVMAENIQDAESTIRDTDVADEMMGYVKNNILVQSAQAMLAQANQVPQGVLQLLG